LTGRKEQDMKMVRPEIARRINETCNEALKRWYKANMIEANKPFYNDHPEIKAAINEEADFIAEVLKARKLN
jgi:hypothetical protein